MFPTFEQVAVHEAGHAVMAQRCGVRVSAITVNPSARRYGCVRLRLPPGPLDPRKGILISLGGSMAEAVHRFGAGNIDLTADWADDSTDFRNASRYAKQIVGCSSLLPSQVLDHASAKCHRLLCRPETWDTVLAAAAALMERRTLQGCELETLVHKANLTYSFGPLADFDLTDSNAAT